MNADQLLIALINEGYVHKTWHGANLKQSLKGVTAKQAAWRPAPGAHNIWEFVLHAAYWKYTVRRRMEGQKRGSFVLKGSNFFARPEKGKATEAGWHADKAILGKEHQLLEESIQRALKSGRARKVLPSLYGIAFHDVYHAGQIRLLRRLQQRS